jgi:hypothetical protein
MKLILTFESIHAVLKAEKLLKQGEFAHEIVPTPREISSDCGMAIRVSEEIGEKAKTLLVDKGVNTELQKTEG